jgi:hypothetical protein
LERPIEDFSRKGASTDLSPAFQDFSMWICYTLQLVKIYHKDGSELRIPQWGSSLKYILHLTICFLCAVDKARAFHESQWHAHSCSIKSSTYLALQVCLGKSQLSHLISALTQVTMFHFLRPLLAVALTATSIVQAYSDPGACSGHCWAHDPSIVERDGTYFKFNTGSGIEIATASSIAGPWTLQGYALPDGSKISVTGNTGSDLWVRVASPELR